jgi:HEAT repeat protein
MRHRALSGQEPQLSAVGGQPSSGLEPLLGGLRRAVVDVGRIQAILNAPNEAELQALLAHVIRFGQAPAYADELVQIVPAHARQKTGNWRGRFTPSQRCRAIQALALIGGHECIPALLDALSDTIYEVRQAARHALPLICTRLDPLDRRTFATYRLLVESLRTLPMQARRTVTQILAGVDREAALNVLLRYGLHAPEWWARRESAWVLGMLGDRRATRRLLAALHDSAPSVRASAAWALGRLDAPIAIEPLSAAAQSDEDEAVRAAAIGALGALIARLDPLDETLNTLVDRLAQALHDPELPVRRAAVDALSALDLPYARLKLRAWAERANPDDWL